MTAIHSFLEPCLHTGNSFKDQGTGCRISIQPRTNETVVLFVIDDESNATCRLRERLGMSSSDAVCDCIVAYDLRGNPDRVLCLVELKSSQITHAVDQIVSTYNHFKTHFAPIDFDQVHWKAYIYIRGGSPRDIKRLVAPLERHFKQGTFAIRRDSDIGNFLRR
jgi:hypothetical protein